MTTITLEPTPQIVRLSERPARIWIGHTAGGIAVQALVSGIVVERTDSAAELEQLVEQPPLAFHGIPLEPGADALKLRQGWRSLCQRCGLSPEHATLEQVEAYVLELQRLAVNPQPPNFPSEPNLARYAAQEREWQSIRDELITRAAGAGEPGPTAYQVTLEQRKRMLSRGERPVTFEELCPPRHGTNGDSEPHFPNPRKKTES